VLYDRKQEANAKLVASIQTKQTTTDVPQQENDVLKLKASYGTTLVASEIFFDHVGTWSDDDVLDG